MKQIEHKGLQEKVNFGSTLKTLVIDLPHGLFSHRRVLAFLVLLRFGLAFFLYKISAVLLGEGGVLRRRVELRWDLASDGATIDGNGSLLASCREASPRFRLQPISSKLLVYEPGNNTALSSFKSTSTGTRLPFISCKPRMRRVDDSEIITETEVANDYAEVYIQLDQPSSSNEQFTDIDEDEIGMEEIVPDPDDDDEDDYDNSNIIVQDDISEEEESTGNASQECGQCLRVDSKLSGLLLTEADDILVDEADFDDDHFDNESDTMDVDEDFQEDHIIVSDDSDGVDDDGYLSDSSLRSTATQLRKSRLKSRSLVIRIL
ncbi:hypothetical protein L484_002026 [Morus notabilis]|uniref:Uncharacterized protein n=1 Tax=Morus notabilis TaxID=981085 RepID=W9RE21_9ROSA|nr:hypothetical protein L484_002026 [Morus notabilis]